MATTNSAFHTLTTSHASISIRDFIELAIGFVGILAILWLPSREQLIFGPIVLLGLLVRVLWTHPGANELGLGRSGVVRSVWIFPAAVGLSIAGIMAAGSLGTLHGPYQADFRHVAGYLVWTLYQQFLLQDFFMPRLSRILSREAAVVAAGVLFAIAHIPNLPLVLATLVWGVVSCALFRRYRSLYVLGIAQGLLGLCFAVCIPDAMLHHMRVGLGYFQYPGARG